MPKTMSRFNHADHRGGNDGFLTPRWIIEALNGFDLDPCYGEPRPWPTAQRMIGPPEDGLSLSWSGRVWLNPPYSRVAAWIEALADHGNGTALVYARTDTEWFQTHVFRRASGILFLKGRLSFHRPDGSLVLTSSGKPSNAGSPSCLVAYDSENALALNTSSLDAAMSTGLLDGHLVSPWND